MTEKNPSEPSMDEILASIRQIISSDSKEEPQPYFPNTESEDILDLTDAFPEDHNNAPLSSDLRFHDVKEWTSNTNQKHWSHEEEPLHSFNVSPECSVDSSFIDDSLLSQATVSETTQAFHLLNKNVQEKSISSNAGSEGQVLENLMREMLKPLLKEWLNTHLPSIVHEIVTQEVEKIVQQADGGSHNKRTGSGF